MACPWRSPLDIMRKHKIKRASSDVGVGPTRSSLASCLVRQVSEGKTAVDRSTPKSKSDLSLQTRLSQKRRNPFSRESAGSPKKKKSLTRQSPQKSPSTPPDQGAPQVVVDDGRERLNLLRELDGLNAFGNDDHVEPCTEEAQKAISQCVNAPMTPQLTSPKESFKSPPLKELKKVLAVKEVVKVHHCEPPVDWSIKTKLRIVSPIEETPKARQPGIEAKHMHNFVHRSLETGPEWPTLDLHQRVRRCCFHYIHPHMPWIQAFPRTTIHFRSRVPSVAANNEEVLKSLHNDWCDAFTSVYQQLRCGICPYFYLCCHQFTVLFRCQRSQDNTSWSALLSPSTRGLRELLVKEGIPFTLPNSNIDQPSKPCDIDSSVKPSDGKENQPDGDTIIMSPKKQSTTSPSSPTKPKNRKKHSVNDVLNEIKDNNESEDDEEDEKDGKNKDEDSEDEDLTQQHDGASQWLESMGMNRKDFPELEPDKVKIQLEGFREIDNRPTSMVYVEGPDIHPFFDFLLNHQNCTAPSGDQMGLPPTIMAPGPFLGGTMIHNSVKVSTIKETSDEGLPVHVYEVAGPLMPHHTLNIASIVKTQYGQDTQELSAASSIKSGTAQSPAQSGQSVTTTKSGTSQSSIVSYSTYTPSAAFNTHKINDPLKDKMAEGWHKMTVDPSLASAGLHHRVSHLLSAKPVMTTGHFVKDLEVGNKGFSW